MKKNIQLIAAIINSKNEILLEKYTEGYKLPVGSILSGERIEDSYKRFVKQDTGLIVEVIKCVYAFNFDDVDTISIVFSCTPLSKYKEDNVLPSQYEWYSFKDTKKLNLPFPWREVVTRAMYIPEDL